MKNIFLLFLLFVINFTLLANISIKYQINKNELIITEINLNHDFEYCRWILESSIYYDSKVTHVFNDTTNTEIILNTLDKNGIYRTYVFNIDLNKNELINIETYLEVINLYNKKIKVKIYGIKNINISYIDIFNNEKVLLNENFTYIEKIIDINKIKNNSFLMINFTINNKLTILNALI